MISRANEPLQVPLYPPVFGLKPSRSSIRWDDGLKNIGPHTSTVLVSSSLSPLDVHRLRLGPAIRPGRKTFFSTWSCCGAKASAVLSLGLNSPPLGSVSIFSEHNHQVVRETRSIVVPSGSHSLPRISPVLAQYRILFWSTQQRGVILPPLSQVLDRVVQNRKMIPSEHAS